MKLTFATILVIVSLPCMATIRTVNNKGGAQYISLQAALDAAVHGDTIYVHGSTLSYGDASVKKRVVLIGAGFKPINQQNLPSTISNLYLIRDNGTSDATASVICGFAISALYGSSGASGLTINNVRIFRNSIGTVYAGGNGISNEGWLIYNNRFNTVYGSGNGGTSKNIAIQNNFARYVYNMSESSVLIDHNVFIGSGNFYNVYYATISNNIFIRTSGEVYGDNVNYCTFTNNITNLTTVAATNRYSPGTDFVGTYTGTGGGANTGANNIRGVDIQLENVTDLNNFSDVFNYRLKSSSPAKGAGSDGTDLGVYAPPYPFPSGGAPGSGFDTSPTPPVPQVLEVNIQNATINPNGTLTVKVKASINN
jgi:hypothetical protein